MKTRAAVAWLRSPSPWLLLFYIAGSSLLGLSLGVSQTLAPGHPLFSLAVLVGDLHFWMVSIPADIAFVLGTALTAWVSRAWDASKLVLPVVSALGSLVTYELAFAIWLSNMSPYANGTTAVVIFGYPGLIFGGLAPVAWRLLRERRRSAAARDLPAERYAIARLHADLPADR